MTFKVPPLARIVLVLAALCLARVVQAAPPPRGPLVPKDPSAQPCTHPTINISGQVQLQQDCIYEHHFVINTSNTTLDCNGAQIALTDPSKVAVRAGGEIDNVLVKNCYVFGGKGVAVVPPARLDGESNDDYRKRSPTNIVVANMYVTKSSNVGIYIHHHVVGATVQDSIIEDNNRPGIYFGAESQGSVVRNNLIRDNGFRTEDGLPDFGWSRREGIAVDASAFNTIEDNHFEGNAFGGILLYKNCWEHAASNPDSHQRIQHSHSNVIRNNGFSDMEFGVWVAARQARNLMFMECGDPTPYNNPIWISTVFHASYPVFKGTYPAPYLPLVSIWPDFAENNTIEGNTLEKISKAGIRIEDDQTTVIGNLFIGDFEYIYLGTPFRANLINQPVDGTTISDNSFASPASQVFVDQLALVPGEHTGTQLSNNLRACHTPWGEWIRNGAQVDLETPDPAHPGQSLKQQYTCADGVLQCTDSTCQPPLPPDAGVPDSGAADLGGEDGTDAAIPDLQADAADEKPSSSGGCQLGLSTGTDADSRLSGPLLLLLLMGLVLRGPGHGDRAQG